MIKIESQRLLSGILEGSVWKCHAKRCCQAELCIKQVFAVC